MVFSQINRVLRPLLLAGLILFTAGAVLLLAPVPLEHTDSPQKLEQKDLLPYQEGEDFLAPGIPENQVPEYTVENFNYVSTHAGQRNWQILAERAHVFNLGSKKGKAELVHSKVVAAHLFSANPNEKPTLVTGKEAKYLMGERDLEVFGNVITTFPDGFVLRSEYLRYLAKEKRIAVPNRYFVKGEGATGDSNRAQSTTEETADQWLTFRSYGMNYDMKDATILLPSQVEVSLRRNQAGELSKTTTIRSDRCLVYRDREIANFFMNTTRKIEEQFIEITQPSLAARSREAELSYGKLGKSLRYLTLQKDVLIKENTEDDELLRYATSGRADFDSTSDSFILTEFPQVYQNNDTVTGEVIIVHRDTDIVEVEHGNAFSTGDAESYQ